jgi:uncharacterized protein (TIRG00374 family)
MKKQHFLGIMKLVVAAVLIFILYREVNQGQAIMEAFRQANWVNVTFASVLLIPNFFLQYLRWLVLLKSRFPDIGKKTALQSLLFGTTLGFITPGNLGELARALFFKKYDKWVITGLNVIDKLYGTIIFFTFGLIFVMIILFGRFHFHPYIALPAVILALIFLLVVWVLTLNPRRVRGLLNGMKLKFLRSGRMQHLLSALDNLTGSRSAVLVLITVSWFFVIVLQYHLLILAFTNISFMNSFQAVSAILFTKTILPISFADLGIREGASVFYYRFYAIDKAVAFNTSLLIFVINFLVPSIVGSFFVFKLRWEFKNFQNRGRNKSRD